VRYARGPVDEEYTLRSEAMEQTFVVNELPASRGAITVTGVVSTNLTAPADGAKGEKLGFTYKGRELITLSEAVAIDAAGRKLPLELEWSGGRLAMTVPADWVASATLPIKIDPLVGSPFSVFSTTDPNTNYTVGNAWPVRMVDAAYSPTNATWFVVWTQRWGTGGSNGFDYDVRAQRVSATGTLVGGVVGIDTSTGGAYEPSISYSSGSSFDRYLIAYRFDPSNNLSDTDQRIQGKIHGGDGVFVTLNPFTIEDPAGQDMAPTSAFDGTNWYVSYTNKVSSSNYDVRGRFVSTAGTPGTSASPDTTTGDSAYMSSVSYANGAYMIVWNKGTTSSGTISARTMLPSGSFPTAITTVEPSTNGPREADVSGGGTKFLIVWRNNSNQSISGRTADAGTGSTITFPTSTFPIQTSSASARSTPRAAYSATSDAWFSLWADAATNGTDIYGARVSSAGVVSPVEQISSDASWEWRPELAWNSATNEMLLVYNFGSGSPSFAVKAQRYSMTSGGSPPPAPANFRGTAQTTGSLLWEWDNVAGETGFEVRDASQAVKGTAGVDVLAFTETVGLTENASYSRHVNATSGFGPSADSNVAAKYTKVHDPLAGDFSVSAASSSQINVVVTAPPNSALGSTGCEIDRSPDGSTGWVTVRAFSAVYTFNDTGLASNTTYFYRFHYRNGDGIVTAYSSVKSGTTLPLPPAAPTGLAASAGNAQVVLTWSASAGATSYKVFRSTTSGSYGSPIATGVAESPFTDSGLSNGTTYFYVVRASNSGGDSGNSNEVSATPIAPPAAPTGLAATPGNAQVALTWTASAGATFYTVRRGTAPGGPYPTTFTGVTPAAYTDTSAANGTTYYYVVAATNAGGTSGNSNEASATPTAPPGVPGGVSATVANNQVTVSWSAVSGATSYTVKRGTTSGGPYPMTFSGIVASPYVDNSAVNGTTYYYVVTAVNAGGESAASTQVSAAPPGSGVPSAPTNLQAVGGNLQVSLTWTASSTGNPTSYTVKRSNTQGSGYLFVGNSTTTSFLDTTVSNNTSYFYVVTAINGLGESGNSNEAAATPADLPAAPTGLTAQAHEAIVELNWNPVQAGGIAGYNIYRATSASGPFTLRINGPVESLAHFEDFDRPNGTYYYVVRSIDLTNHESVNSNVASAVVTAIDPPSGLTATGLNGRVSLNWTSVSGAFSYNLMRATVSGGPYVTVGNTASTSMVSTGLTNGVLYYFIVTCVTSAGESRPSTEATATPNPPGSFDVLFVVGNGSLSTADAGIQQRLVDLGYTPTVEINSATSAGAAGKKLVVLSATCNPATVGAAFAGTNVPLLNLNADLMNPLGMTGNMATTDFGSSSAQTSIDMVASQFDHPLSAAFSGTVDVLAAPGDSITYGKPNSNGLSIATLAGDASKSAIFTYDSGAGMVSGTAPARRTGFFVGPTSAMALTPEGKRLFDTAVAWTVGAPMEPVTVDLVPGGDHITLNWEKSSGALSYRVYRALSADGPWTSVGGELSGTTFVDFNVVENITYYYRVVALNDFGPGAAFFVQQGRRQTITYRMNIEGPRTLQVKRPDGTRFPDHYDTGIYTPLVHKITTTFDGQGNVIDETSVNANNELSGIVTYEVDPGVARNQLNVVEQGFPNFLNPLQLNATTNRGTIYLRCGVKKSGEQNIFLYGNFSVTVDTRYNFVTVSFKFPDCTPQAARTQQDPPPPAPGDPDQTPASNQHLWGTQTEQGRARSRFYPPYIDRANQIWRQAAIRFYGSIYLPDDHVLPPQGDTRTWFHASNNGFITDSFRTGAGGGRSYRPSVQFTILADQNNHDSQGFYAPGISVYFFHAIYSNEAAARNATVHGETYPADGDNRRRNTIVLADSRDATTVNFAHELGHVLMIRHVGETRPNDLNDGIELDPVAPGVNNLVPLIPRPAAAGYTNMLMYRGDPPGAWLPSNQVDAARAELLRRSTFGNSGWNLQSIQEP
jgi:fibronectin type 3 domain-containing protein